MTQNLENIALEIYDYPPVDLKIANLVRAIQNYGIDTKASCQGHLDKEHHHFPWVGLLYGYWGDEQEGLLRLKQIKLSKVSKAYHKELLIQEIALKEKIIEFYKLLQEYNSQNATSWILEGTWLRPDTNAENERELKRLQEDGENLAIYIFRIAQFHSVPALTNL